MTARHSDKAAERLLLVDFTADEMALLAEMIVKGSMDRAEFLQGLHPAEAGHRRSHRRKGR